MLNDMTRARLIAMWLLLVALVIGGAMALGVTVTIASGVLLLALCLAPVGIILMLWPGMQSPTAGDVLRGTDAPR